MAALTEDTQRSRMTIRKPQLVSLPAAAATQIYAGALVARDAGNLLVPASDAAGLLVVGVAYEGLDNTADVAGTYGPPEERTVTVDRGGVYLFDVTFGIGADPIYGVDAFVVDDGTVSPAGGANNVRVGSFVKPDEGDSSRWYVDLAR